MIIKKETKGGIAIYHLGKNIPHEKMVNIMATKVKHEQIDFIIKDDADVYDENGNLLLRFRKNKLDAENVKKFYDNVIQFALRTTTNRGSASGSKKMNVKENPKIMSNILGYFDRFGPSQKSTLKKKGIKLPLYVRETYFNMEYPEKFKEAVPLIKEIDEYYEKYAPDHYVKQRKKADETPFKIDGTSFTTITTNVNFQTNIHTDKGDDPEGFGNLVVIENGKYSGGETCFPQYGVGVDLRTGDILFMNVHQPHGNLPIKLESADAKRLSIVCYLRHKIWEKTRGKSRTFMEKHNKTIRNLRAKG